MLQKLGPFNFLPRFFVFSVLLTGNLVFMSYRAAITSDLAVWSIKMPFSSLSALLETEYRLKTLSGGLMQNYFENSAQGTILNDVYLTNMLPHGNPFVDTLEALLANMVNSDGMEAVFNTLVRPGKSAKNADWTHFHF